MLNKKGSMTISTCWWSSSYVYDNFHYAEVAKQNSLWKQQNVKAVMSFMTPIYKYCVCLNKIVLRSSVCELVYKPEARVD